jgi:ring-1,2-phenylacetyl-CoA epoxidase subunit PaaE
MATFNTLVISKIQRETSKAVSISFDVPESLKNTYAFEAGQYLTLKTKIDGQEIRRDYSISSSPRSNDLTVTIKEIENGIFSSFANQELKVGESIAVAPPKGRFTYTTNSDRQNTIVAFAAGSGITPIMSILKTVLDTNTSQKFVLVYGNKTPEETIFFKTLHDLKTQYPTRIDKGNTNYSLKNLINIDQTSAFYLCGPEKMIHTVKEVLLQHNVCEDDILFELFTATTTVAEAQVSIPSGPTKATVLVDDETTEISVNSEQTILEAALKHDVDVPYSCQGGVCSSCICRITKGTAEMRQNSVLTDGEVAEGLVLSCQAVPTSAVIHIDFDDV